MVGKSSKIVTAKSSPQNRHRKIVTAGSLDREPCEPMHLMYAEFKFTREKLISVGEDFYRFSAYALLRFETLLDTYQKMLGYSQAATNIMLQVDENLKILLTKIGENNITITSADIFFGVSGADIAAKFSMRRVLYRETLR